MRVTVDVALLPMPEEEDVELEYGDVADAKGAIVCILAMPLS